MKTSKKNSTENWEKPSEKTLISRGKITGNVLAKKEYRKIIGKTRATYGTENRALLMALKTFALSSIII